MSVSSALSPLFIFSRETDDPAPFLPVRPRLFTILCKFTHNFFPFGCHPLEGSPGAFPLVTPLGRAVRGWSAPALVIQYHKTGAWVKLHTLTQVSIFVAKQCNRYLRRVAMPAASKVTAPGGK